jgi:hypothetical protein
VHSVASWARNVDVLFFIPGWDQSGFHKKCTGTRYAELVFLHPLGSVSHIVHSCVCGREMSTCYFYARVGPVRIPQKAHWDTLRRSCVFTSSGICESHSGSEHPGHEMSTQYFSCSGGTSTDSKKTLSGHVTSNECFCIQWDMRVT